MWNWVVDFFSFLPYLIIAILILLLMITIHELGHYLIGKKLGFKINEFAIGMGKPLYTRINKETGEKFTIRLFPLGGFCAFEGETEEDGKESHPGAFHKQKPWKRILVLIGGVSFNFLSAIIFAVFMLTFSGYHIQTVNLMREDSINTYSISNPYGLKEGDAIYKVDGKSVTFWGDNFLNPLIADYALDEEFTLTVKRDGEMVDVTVKKYEVEIEGEKVAVLGIAELASHRLNLGESLLLAVPFSLYMFWQILVLLLMLFTGQIALSSAGGPISSIGQIATISQSNAGNILRLLPLISINLAVFNILPIPALDGSKVVFTAIEWVRGKPINPKIENAIHIFGLFALLGFVILLDILQIFV